MSTITNSLLILIFLFFNTLSDLCIFSFFLPLYGLIILLILIFLRDKLFLKVLAKWTFFYHLAVSSFQFQTKIEFFHSGNHLTLFKKDQRLKEYVIQLLNFSCHHFVPPLCLCIQSPMSIRFLLVLKKVHFFFII